MDKYDTFNYGSVITINCTIDADPVASAVYWMKEAQNEIRKLETGLGGTRGMTLEQPSLTIEYTSVSDAGLYTCFARNSIGIGKSKSVNVTVYGGNFLLILLLYMAMYFT